MPACFNNMSLDMQLIPHNKIRTCPCQYIVYVVHEFKTVLLGDMAIFKVYYIIMVACILARQFHVISLGVEVVIKCTIELIHCLYVYYHIHHTVLILME